MCKHNLSFWDIWTDYNIQMDRGKYDVTNKR